MNPIIIAAVDNKNGIGKVGILPWRIPEDMSFFAEQTRHSCVIMGRTTHESIGRELPGRVNIVVSRTYQGPVKNRYVPSLQAAFDKARAAGRDRVFVIGGAEIYRQALPYCNSILLTRIPLDYACDTHFPQLDEGPTGWKRVMVRNSYAESLERHLTFTYYERHQPVAFE